MKRYKLLKDLPTFKAGDLFYISEYGALVYDDGGFGIMAYAQSTLEKFPNILTEWFEEIQEPTDSIHWKPKKDEKIWYLDKNHDIAFTYFNVNSSYHRNLLRFGNAYRTSQDCEKARKRKLAKVRLRQTSTFKPDFKNGKVGWVVGYDYEEEKLNSVSIDFIDYGDVAYYRTWIEAEKSIEENREDWLIYFGVE